MIPHDDDGDDLALRADSEFRRLTILRAISELAMMRAQEIDDAQIRIYTLGLIDLDPELVVDACKYLGQRKREEGETALPSVGDIRDRCWQIRVDEKRLADERAYAYRRDRDREGVSHARPEVKEWARASFDAISRGQPRPPMPRLLESSAVTYRCADCLDTGFCRACHCEQRGCDNCKHGKARKCLCRPQAAPISSPAPAPRARARNGKNWHRVGE